MMRLLIMLLSTLHRGAENIPPANLRRDGTVSLPELDSWTPSQTTLVLVLIVHELIMTGGPVPDDLLGPQEGGMTDSFAPDQLINLDLFEGTIFSGRVKTAQGLVARYLGLTDSWALEVEAHKTRWVRQGVWLCVCGGGGQGPRLK